MSSLSDTPVAARILLVDDDEDVRAVTRRVLTQAGHDVTEAASADDAAPLIADLAPFDMLVTDVRMPGRWDGVDLAQVWQVRAPKRPVLFMSGYDDERLHSARLETNHALLAKPFRRMALQSVVERLLGAAG